MEHTPEEKERANEISRQIIGAAIEVHRILGPGLLESAYQAALERELELRGIKFEPQVPLRLNFKGRVVPCSYRMDLKVEGLVLVELKSAKKMKPIYEAQLLTYLRLTDLWLGLLINFNVILLKEGIKRMVNG